MCYENDLKELDRDLSNTNTGFPVNILTKVLITIGGCIKTPTNRCATQTYDKK